MSGQTLPTRIWKWGAVIVLLLGLVITALVILYPIAYRQTILDWCNVYELDEYLVLSVIRTESHFRPQALSPVGAIGLMQIMPTTGQWIAEKNGIEGFAVDDLYKPETNIHLGSWYLRYLIDRFTDVDAALAAYNAGPGTVDGWIEHGSQLFPETASYIRRVRRTENIYQELYGLPILGPLLLAMQS